MSKTGRTNHRRGSRGRPKSEHRVTVRGVQKQPPDLRKLSRAVMVIAQREADLDEEAKAALLEHQGAGESELPEGAADD